MRYDKWLDSFIVFDSFLRFRAHQLGFDLARANLDDPVMEGWLCAESDIDDGLTVTIE